jgi:type II secretory pathway pseudopilin PulG
MMSRLPQDIFSYRQRRRRGGFSFIEVLFAVILLGIGFIMIAGIFPVAIEQSTTTANETAGQLVCRDAIRMIQNAASMYGGSALFAATPVSTNSNAGTLIQFPASLYQALGANTFFTTDRRYAWVGFYRRDANPSTGVAYPYAQVFVIALENPNFSNYAGPPPIPGTPGTPPPTSVALAAATINASLNENAGVSNVTFSGAGLPTPSNAVTGAFVLVANDPGNTGSQVPRPAGTLNGRLYRLGVDQSGDTDSTEFQLEPGMDLNNSNNDNYEGGSGGNLTCFMIGRAPANVNGTGNFTGPNQDIAAMSAMISVNTATN